MRRGARVPRAGTAAALLAASLTMSLAAACTSPHRASDDGRAPAPSPTADRSTHPGSVLAVKIDNVPAARPQTGLDSADVVYAEQVEGGLSRLMAVYATHLPETIGPVRSARESDLELLRQFEEPTLAFSGAQSKLLPLIDKAPLRAETPDNASGAFYRGGDKPAPHNLYLRPDRLMPSAPGGSALTTGFRYGDRPPGGTDGTTRTVRYPAARFTFTWSPDRHRYLVAMDGTPALTTDGRRVAASTVVVQYVEMRTSRFHDFLGNGTPYTQTVGSGKAEVLRDGRAYDVTWKRPKATDGTEFTTKGGNPMTFADGQVWVVFAPSP
ncbi:MULTISPECIES: DUF3048 domain-containing protein [unclassified Streptomyces]|uniref:DUF3048 domain-containing protein n=1 Tax=unclassified Streptomyces TaxID=2593676 RepID=UPI001F039D58|nr:MULTISPECIES: DUF3048 domain-containing protein [unclassified Streptomyces]MCH0563523.1 DUF3048 domain-containing protein [Streptomyces sp. MUM 2J]MCH0570219.1 DUF3048 domain-containing protein [Streptomyces sp. MUM 136J]